MKVVAFAFSILLVGATFAAGNPIDDLVKEALEYIRYLLETNDPLKLPPIPVQNINDVDGDIFVTATIKELYISNASDFQVNQIDNNVLALWAKFSVFLPSLHVEGSYAANGTVKGLAVTGDGNLVSDVQNLNVTGFMQLKMEYEGIQIDELDVDYTVEGLTLSLGGLTVEGMSTDEVTSLFQKYLLTFFQENSAVVAQRIANQFKLEANEIIKGMTLSEIIDWLKHFIQPTAAPQFVQI